MQTPTKPLPAAMLSADREYWLAYLAARSIPSGDCLIWQRATWRGYGQFATKRYGNSRTFKAHRLAYALRYGDTPMQVNHHCDTRACVNPAHLYAGSQRDNLRDRQERNLRYMSAAMDARARRLSANGLSNRAIARELGYSREAIRRCLTERS